MRLCKNSSRCSKELEQTVWKRCVTPETINTSRHGKAINRQYDQRSARQRQTDFNSCSRFGKKHHPKKQCPAKDAVCRRCQQKGHYKAYCFTKLEKISTPEEVGLDSAFLNTVVDETNTSFKSSKMGKTQCLSWIQGQKSLQ